tara:strand:- start:2465 stop:2662 length:198 start_codon:yes stop_codon:yes gene_type:complete
MYSYLFGHYFYRDDMINIINEVETRRKVLRNAGQIPSVSFSEDLKNKLMGIESTIIKFKSGKEEK